MPGYMEWLEGLDPQWLAVFGTVLAGMFTIRAARMAARSAGAAVRSQKEIAESSGSTQRQVADLGARAQLIATREQHRFQLVSTTYVRTLQHLDAWHTWAHELNRYLYASKSLDDPDWGYWDHRNPDDPRDPRNLSNPEPADVPMPDMYPPSVSAPGDTEAHLAMYASDEIRSLLEEWKIQATDLRGVGLHITGAGRAAKMREAGAYPGIFDFLEKAYPENVRKLDAARESVIKRARFELAPTRTAILDEVAEAEAHYGDRGSR